MSKRLKLYDKDLKLFLDIVTCLNDCYKLKKYKLNNSILSNNDVNREIFTYRYKINRIISKLQKRLNITTLTEYLIKR